MLSIKNKKNKNITCTIISIIITLLSLFCSITLIKFPITNNLYISNYLLYFGLFGIAFLLSAIYIYKLVNYIRIINFLKKIKLEQINKNLFNNLIKKVKIKLNPVVYLVLAISIWILFVSMISEDNLVKYFEISKSVYINKITFLLLSFSTFEFLSIIFIFVILNSIRNKKFKWTYIKKISNNLYLKFLNLASVLSIKFYQLKNKLLNFYTNLIKELNFYDIGQRNIIAIKKRFFLAEKLKGECPPNSII